MDNNVLVTNNLCFSAGKQILFQNFNISIKHGEIVSIIGANKCGKSTLIKLLSGFLETENMVTVNNITLNEKSKDGFSKKVGLICQNSSTFEGKVKEYITLDVKKKDTSFYNKIIDILSIKPLLDENVYMLDTDDFVLVEMCRNLLKKPSVLFIDYTNTIMSNALKTHISSLYELLTKEDIAIVFATNDASDILISDTTYVLHKGMIALAGPTKEVVKQDSLLLKLGVELPFEVDLSLKLGMYDLVDDIYYDIDELVDKLWK